MALTEVGRAGREGGKRKADVDTVNKSNIHTNRECAAMEVCADCMCFYTIRESVHSSISVSRWFF